MQPIEGNAFSPAAAAGVPCPQCSAVVAPALLTCPQCRALVHRHQLEQLAHSAEAAATRGDITGALSHWRKALPLLPADSKQAKRITSTIRELRARQPQSPANGQSAPGGDAATPITRSGSARSGWKAAATSALAFAAFKLKAIWMLVLTGWKPLLLGLTKLGTVWTMLLSVGVYWSLYGWPFAVGLIGCIYVHEIGHVVALKQLGIAASAPMFIPGFGAVVRMQEYPIDVDEEAQVGLAGPRWGLGITLVVALAARLAHSPLLGVIAHLSAYINLFNLLPIPPLDGGRGFRALAREYRFALAVVLAVAYWLTAQAFVGIIALLAFGRAFERTAPTARNLPILIEFAVLGSLLAYFAR